ncbi:MAG TPA: transporter [Paracoccus sp. (in: a-proteobacteria)]|uniref:SphA family protein n=1 Tax=uncultured Paracoccus sp. TaxID=189685 RepID=UPI00263879E5|nr:transporter [uncultured Paracoccus sp.]HMQ40629.1 transporter [Paracoccus sp. (in: a-proteobacteria)]HMR36586.1 transporter [Paracoccus sp. (in: a-proteobacteria)]
MTQMRQGAKFRHAGRRAGMVLAAGMLASGMAGQALGAEGGVGFYILGSRTINAGIVPPPGTYLQFSTYGFSGYSNVATPQNGRINLGLSGDALIGLYTAVWSLDSEPVLGGQPYLAATLPIGWKKTTLDGQLARPGGNIVSGSRDKDSYLIGDPVIGGGIGWGEGPWFTSLNLLINIPAGDYETGRPTNVSFNRWGADLTGGITWMNANGWQVSGALGLTVNGENDDTNYNTGNELHLEGAVAKTTGSWTLGLAGYHYNQVSGDSSETPLLGEFKGRVSGIGPVIGWSGMWGQQPVSLDARFYHEFDAKNRVEGNTVLFNLTIPLGG